MRKAKTISGNCKNLIDARQQGHAIEAASANIEILVKAIFEKIGQVGKIDHQAMQAMESISCFADCALKQLEAIKFSQEKMMGLIAAEMEGLCHD